MKILFPSSPFFGCFATVYGLYDKRDRIFYVGVTLRPLYMRLGNHISSAKNKPWEQTKKNSVIIGCDYKISIKPLQVSWITGRNKMIVAKKARAIEKRWIKEMASISFPLTNVNDHAIPTLEGKKRIFGDIGAIGVERKPTSRYFWLPASTIKTFVGINPEPLRLAGKARWMQSDRHMPILYDLNSIHPLLIKKPLAAETTNG